MKNLDPTWPESQRLTIIAKLSEKLRRDPAMIHRDIYAIADTISVIALADSAILETNKQAILEMVEAKS